MPLDGTVSITVLFISYSLMHLDGPLFYVSPLLDGKVEGERKDTR